MVSLLDVEQVQCTFPHSLGKFYPKDFAVLGTGILCIQTGRNRTERNQGLVMKKGKNQKHL